jgi:hypothetical protein
VLELETLRHNLEAARQGGTLRPEGFAENREFVEFGRVVTELYRAILRVGGKSVVVDSSKDPAYALLLAAIPSIDLRVVHLLRDARGVAWSYTRKSIPAWRSALRWWRVNSRATSLVTLLGPERSLRVRYEDLLSAPNETIARISRMFDLNYSDIVSSQKNGFAHTVAGNRVRNNGAIRLRTKDEWQETMRQTDRWMVSLLAAWPLLRYGYSPKPFPVK